MPHEPHTHDAALVATAILGQDHLLIHRVVVAMTRLAEELEFNSGPPADVLDDLVFFLRVFVDQYHHAKEDRVLFPALEAKGVPTGGCPIGALEHEHEKGRTLCTQLAGAIDLYKAQGLAPAKALLAGALRGLTELYPSHIWKEDYMLIPMSDKILTAAEQQRLAQEFRQIEAGIGAGVHERLVAFPAAFERAVGRMENARGVGVAPIRTPEETGGPVLELDLNAHIETLMGEPNWQAGRDSQTLVKYKDLRLVLVVLRTGSRLHEHQAAGSISVHVLRGHVRMHAAGRAVDLPAGRIAAIDQMVAHSVEAVEDSAFLLTISWPSAGYPANRPTPPTH